jgi:uncharacterized protein
MNKIIILSVLLLFFSSSSNAQYGKIIQKIKLVDVNDIPEDIPYLGEKVLTLFYVDPDVEEITDPIADALVEKKYTVERFGAIGVVNCKDSWVPNTVITSIAELKQKKFPEASVLLDKNYLLPDAWSLGNCDNVAIILVVGKDLKIKFVKAVKSQEECRNIILSVIKIIEDELKKI